MDQTRKVLVDGAGGVWYEIAQGCWSRSRGYGSGCTLSELRDYGIQTTEAYLVPADKWGRFDTVRRAKDGALHELEQAREKIKDLEKRVDETRSERNTLRLQRHNKTLELEQFKRSLEAWQSTASQQLAQIQDLRKRLVDLQQELEKAEQRLEKATGELLSLRQGLAGALGVSNPSTDDWLIAACKGHLVAFQRTAEGWQATARQQLTQIQDLRKRLHEATREHGEAREHVKHLRDQLERWKKRAEELEQGRIFEATNAWDPANESTAQRAWVARDTRRIWLPPPQEVSLDAETRQWLERLMGKGEK